MDTITVPPPPSSFGPTSDAPTVYDAIRWKHEDRKTAQRNRPIKPRDVRNGDEILLSVAKFVTDHGTKHLAFMTLTFRRHRSWKLAMAAFKLLTYTLEKEFPGWIRVIEFSKRGVIHIHLLVHVPFDIEAGFNQAASVRIHEIDKLGKKITADQRAERIVCYRNLTTNTALISLMRRLRDSVKRCGFGWKFEITPIRTEPEFAAKYLLKGLYATVRLRKQIPRNAQIFSYGGDFPRVKAPPSAGQIRFQKRREAVLTVLGEPL